MSNLTDLVKDVVTDMESNEELVPEPLAEKTYSGKFQVRITPELHRKLAIEAAEEKVSLNRYVSYKLG
jgi:predicted HicB family RNase H-like nuclease